MNRLIESIKKTKSNLRETAGNILSKTITFVADSIPQRYLADKIKEEVNQRIKETIVAEEEDHSWRRLTDQARTRDLSPLKQSKMIKVVDWLYERNAIAKKILGLFTDFVVGEGIKIKADEVKGRDQEQEKLQEIIDRFWDMNEWELKQFDKIEELSKYGEQIYHTAVNKVNADVSLMSIPPEVINKILCDPKNREKLDKIVFYTKAGVEGKTKDIIRERPANENEKDQATTKSAKTLQGDVFFFSINRGTFGTRGKSDLLSIADWLDIYDRTLYTMTERVVFLLSFIWDITIEGAHEEELKKRRDDLNLNPPHAGSYVIHNEKEKWEAPAPKLNGSDFQEYSKTVSGILAGGSGLPVHWLFGQGEDVNKASAKEMSEPTFRKMLRRQKLVVAMFRQMIDFLIQKKIDKNILKGTVEDYPYSVVIPQPSQKEAGVIAESFSKMVPALTIATQNEFLTNETATKVLAMFVNQIGLDVNPDTEMDQAQDNNFTDVEKIQKAFQEFSKKFNKGKANGKTNNEESGDQKSESEDGAPENSEK
jgi:hypothetical protein